jgi:hypothetical protein
MDGTVTLVRTIWRLSSPADSTVPPLGCHDTLKDMLFIDGEGVVANECIPQLRAKLEATTVHLDPFDFPGAIAAIGGVLAAFNVQNGTSYVVDGPCSLARHVSNGAGGCTPGNGHTLLLKNGFPAKANLATRFCVGSMIVAHGLVVTIQYS